MLIFNICIPDLLVNGSLGTVVGIEFTKNGEVEAIIVAFDDPNVGLGKMSE